jgi:Suppressor of fused protein (SUFU)
MTTNEQHDDEWTLWWDARVAAMESVLGMTADTVGHGVIPFQFGAEMGGAADIVYFRNHLDGVVAATSELIGCDDQPPNDQGNYELIICSRADDDWGPNIICQLAHYTLEAVLDPGETMDIGPAVPDGSSIAAFLFCDYGRFKVRDRNAGLLLCVGITADELSECRAGNRERVETALKDAGVFPYTDLFRDSVL